MPGVYRIGNGVSIPELLFRSEPEYSPEALEAKLEGLVLLSVVIDEHGFLRDLQVVNSLGLGLDEKAIEAATKYRFNPAVKDGIPVPVGAYIEINFRLPLPASPRPTTHTLAANPDTPGS